MAIIRGKVKEEYYPKLCSSTLFFTVLRLKKKKSGNQDECFKNFLSIIDPTSVEGIPASTLHRYSSDCKNANALPEDCGYIRFGDENICKAFRDEMKSNPEDALKRVKGFADKYFAPNSHRLVVRTLLSLISNDKSIVEHNRSLYVNPGFVPSLTEEFLKEDATIYFYNFLIGVWFYVYAYYSSAEEGKDTIEHWNVETKPYAADKVKEDLDEVTEFENINILYDTEVQYDEQIKYETAEVTGPRVVLPNGRVPDLASFDPEDDEDGVYVLDIQKVEASSDKFSRYVKGALDNYSMKKAFLDTRERPFRDFYVCNDVCQRLRKPLKRGGSLKDVLVENEKNLNRPKQNITVDELGKHFCVFTGIGGMGKSMMLNKLLLDEAAVYAPGKRVPIMVTLRTYKPDEKSLEVLLLSELKRFDPSLQLSDLYYLLESGRAVCLLDGLDEINKAYVHLFQDELDIMKDGHRNSYFVLSSRDIPEVRTLISLNMICRI